MYNKVDITHENAAEYVTKRTVTVNGGVWDGNKLPVIKMILACFFFSGSIIAISAMGYYFIEAARSKNITSDYFELHDFFANVIHDSFYVHVGLGLLFFVLFSIVLFSNFHRNKVLRARSIMALLFVHMLVFIEIFFFFSCLFIPVTIGSGMRYFVICMSFIILMFFSIYWSKKRVQLFYQKQRSSFEKVIDKVKIWMWPALGILSAISFVTAPATRDARLVFYGAISPFVIVLLVPFIYFNFYYGVGEFLELYYINKFPEAIRMETDFTKEEWYGPKYQRSKEVMQKIHEFEDYINN